VAHFHADFSFITELRKLIPKAGVAEAYKHIISEVFNDETKFSRNERKKYIQDITDLSNKITKARELLLNNAIDASDYKEIKTECEAKIARTEAQLKDLNNASLNTVDVASLLDKALENLKNLVHLYSNADIEGKRTIMGSTFKEK
jgi:site-specific DNA recombinase